MTIKVKKRRRLIFALGLVIVFSTGLAAAQEGQLDGKVFVGQYREKHKRAIKEDELRFTDGEFHSADFGEKGFDGGAYRANTVEGKIHFEAETVSSKQGRIIWRGIINGDSIEVNYQWNKKGWLSDTQKDYLFSGRLKK
jgi:hypothetical protein